MVTGLIPHHMQPLSVKRTFEWLRDVVEFNVMVRLEHVIFNGALYRVQFFQKNGL